MKYFFITFLITFFSISAFANESLNVYTRINHCIRDGRNDEAINLIDTTKNDGTPNVTRLLYVYSYFGKENYKMAYKYLQEIDDIDAFPSVKSYYPLLEYKVGKKTQKEAEQEYYLLLKKSNYDLNYLIRASYFYAISNLWDKLEFTLKKIRDDNFSFTLYAYKELKIGNKKGFIKFVREVDFKNKKGFAYFFFPVLLHEIDKNVDKSNDNLMKSVYHFIKNQKQKSSSCFKKFMIKHKNLTKNDLINIAKKDYSEDVLEIIETLYQKYKINSE